MDESSVSTEPCLIDFFKFFKVQKNLYTDEDLSYLFGNIGEWIILELCSRASWESNFFWISSCLATKPTCIRLKDYIFNNGMDTHSQAYSWLSDEGKENHTVFCKEKSFYDDSLMQIPLIFTREIGSNSYFEPSQRLTHLLGLHSNDQKVFFNIDENGDKEIQLKIIEDNFISCALIKSPALHALLNMHTSSLVRQMIITTPHETGSEFLREEVLNTGESTFTKKEYYSGKAHNSERLRSINILDRIKMSGFEIEYYYQKGLKEHLKLDFYDTRYKKHRTQYAMFNENFTNEFSNIPELPYKTNPIYFKPDAFNEYQSNHEKYEIVEGYVYCKDAWPLRCNYNQKSKQIMILACDFMELPYNEQQRLARFNEGSAGEMDEKIQQKLFKGEFREISTQSETLFEYISQLSDLTFEGKKLFKNKSKDKSFENSILVCGHCITNNFTAWSRYITQLSATVIDGFEERVLRKIAEKYFTPDKKTKSIGLLKALVKHDNCHLICKF